MWIDLHNTIAKVAIYGKLIYATSDRITPGQAFVISETDLSWQCVVFHDEPEAIAAAAQAGMQLLHVRDAPPKLPRRITPENSPSRV